VIQAAEPVYEEMEGWSAPISDARNFNDLPPAAQRYVRRLEALVQTEIIVVSVGAGREQTIVLKNPFETSRSS
jgi:adenylosuccinate synthase